MNSRGRSQFSKSYAAGRNVILARISFGASGAPTLVSGTGMGISSVVRTSAGKYTIAFNQASPALLIVKHIFNSGSAAPASSGLYIAADNTSSASAPGINVVFNAAGTPTDPASGEVVLLEIELNDSALSY